MTEFARNPEIASELIDDMFTQCRIFEHVYRTNNFYQFIEMSPGGSKTSNWWSVYYDPGESEAPETLNIYRGTLIRNCGKKHKVSENIIELDYENTHIHNQVEYSIDVTTKEVEKQDKSEYQPKGGRTKRVQAVTELAEIGLLNAVVTTVHSYFQSER